jgi:hypothetical protein
MHETKPGQKTQRERQVNKGMWRRITAAVVSGDQLVRCSRNSVIGEKSFPKHKHQNLHFSRAASPGARKEKAREGKEALEDLHLKGLINPRSRVPPASPPRPPTVWHSGHPSAVKHISLVSAPVRAKLLRDKEIAFLFLCFLFSPYGLHHPGIQ